MIKINVKQVLKEAEINRNKPKPLPKVKSVKVKSDVPIAGHQLDHIITDEALPEKNDLLHSLEREYADVRMERNKLSSRICTLVEDGADQGILRDLYHKIESYRVPLQQHYDNIAYVKQHGHLPQVKHEPEHEATLYELKDQKRKLIDKRCKLLAKLKPSAKKPKPEQLASWQLELDQCNVMYQDVEVRIKKMEGRA